MGLRFVVFWLDCVGVCSWLMVLVVIVGFVVVLLVWFSVGLIALCGLCLDCVIVGGWLTSVIDSCRVVVLGLLGWL